MRSMTRCFDSDRPLLNAGKPSCENWYGNLFLNGYEREDKTLIKRLVVIGCLLAVCVAVLSPVSIAADSGSSGLK